MKQCLRGEPPDLLSRFKDEITQAYVARRRENAAYRFQWPRRENQSLYEIVHAALASMTDSRCAYCDGYPITSTGEEQVDHFRPKTRPEFHELVCTWDNLFLICSACNKAKLDQWEEDLLRPDEHGYDFGLYFAYRTETGELVPNEAASPQNQLRAQTTIRILDLNRSGACISRRRTVRILLNAAGGVHLEDLDYRFLVPICSP